MKNKRFFLEGQQHSDSYIKAEVGTESGYVSLKLADCVRSIEWNFGNPGNKRAIAKITKIKKLVDEVYAHLTGV